MRNRILAVALNWYGSTLLFSSVSLHIQRLNTVKVTIKCVLHLRCFNLLRLHTFIGMHIQKIKYHIFSWPYFKAFLGNNHHILHFETTIFIVCRSHLPLLGHPSSIKCKKSIIYLTSFVKYYFLSIFIFYSQTLAYLPSIYSIISNHVICEWQRQWLSSWYDKYVSCCCRQC